MNIYWNSGSSYHGSSPLAERLSPMVSFYASIAPDIPMA